MEKFFDQSKDLAQKPTGDSGFFSEYESVLTNDEKKKEFIAKLEEAQANFNEANDKINKLLGDYKNNFADKIADEQRLLELSDALSESESLVKFFRYQIDSLNRGGERLHPDFDSESLKN